MSYAFNDDKSKFELDVVFSDINVNIDGKANLHHTHSAADVVDGVLDVDRGGTGQSTLQAFRNAAGLGNTTGALPVANGGTGATAAASARTNIGATSRRNITANYAGSTAGNPDFMIKSFTGVVLATRTGTTNVNIGVSGYTPIVVMNFYKEYVTSTAYSSSIIRLGAKITSTTQAQVKTMVQDGQAWPNDGYTCKFDVLYVRTALLNQ